MLESKRLKANKALSKHRRFILIVGLQRRGNKYKVEYINNKNDTTVAS